MKQLTKKHRILPCILRFSSSKCSIVCFYPGGYCLTGVRDPLEEHSNVGELDWGISKDLKSKPKKKRVKKGMLH